MVSHNKYAPMNSTRKQSEVRVRATPKPQKPVHRDESMRIERMRKVAEPQDGDLQSTEGDAAARVADPASALEITPCEVVPAGSPRRQAEEWDRRVDQLSTNLVNNTLELAAVLAQLKETKAFKDLGFSKWEAYLESKRLGRTMLSYLLKLGQAGDLSWVVDRNISPTVLLTYAKCAKPAEIPTLIKETIDQVEGQTVKEAEKVITSHIVTHADAYPSSSRGRPSKRVREDIPTASAKLDVSARQARRTPEEPKAWRDTFKATLFDEYESLLREDNREGSAERVSTLIEVLKEVLAHIEADRSVE